MENCSSIFVLDSNKNSLDILGAYLNDLGFKDDVYLFSDFKQGLEEIKKAQDNPIVFVDFAFNQSRYSEIFEEIKLLTTRLVVTSVDYSTATIIKAMRMGAREFLPKPVLRDDLKRVMTVFSQCDYIEESASKIITVYSNKGGIGKTTIAVNLAVELAKNTRDRIALIDLNLQLGDIATFLNINPTFDVAYVIKNLVEKKEETLVKAFEKYKDSDLYVLSDPSYIEQSESITPQQISELFSVLKRVFAYIVVDMSSNIDSNSLQILDKSDLILFTSIVNIPAIRNSQRCLNLFRSRRYPSDKVKFVLNRYMESDNITIEDIESTLNEKVYWKFPNNYFSIMEAINKGVPVSDVNINSNIANSFRDFAIKVSDDIVKETLDKYNGRS